MVQKLERITPTASTLKNYSQRQPKQMVILWVFVNSGSKIRTNNTNRFYSQKLLSKTTKMNCHFMGFRQQWFKSQNEQHQSLLLSKITLKDNQNEWSFYGFSSTVVQKSERTTPIASTLKNYSQRQPKRMVILWVFVNSGSKARTNNTNRFYSQKLLSKTIKTNGHFMGFRQQWFKS